MKQNTPATLIGLIVALAGLACFLLSIMRSTDALKDCINSNAAICSTSSAWIISDKIGFALFCLGAVILIADEIRKKIQS